jgi:YesN/AraC family two-component response regulator
MSDIDILFSDVVMPGLSGVDLAREARRRTPNIKIILASGYHAGSLTRENSGAEDYRFIKKPYRMSEIAKILRMAD